MFKQSQNISVYVHHDQHANLDSLPLRFGFYYKKNTVLDLHDCTNFEHQADDRVKFRAKFADSRGDEVEGTFIGLKNSGKYLKLITVWRNDQRTEEDLSVHLRKLRESHQITPDELVEIWPDYIKGEANSVSGFMASIKRRYQRDAEVLVDEANKRAETAEKLAEEALSNKTDIDEDALAERVAAKVLGQMNQDQNVNTPNTELDAESHSRASQSHSELERQTSVDYSQISRWDQTLLAPKITKIFGPPGTGKTTTLIKLLKEAVANGISPREIGFFSFTNFSTKVARQRVKAEFPNLDIDEDFDGFRTLHSLAYQTLPSKLDLMTPEDARKFDSDFMVEEVMLEEDDITSIVYRAKHSVIDAAAVARSRLISFEDHLKSLNRSDSYRLNKWLGYPSKHCEVPLSAEDLPKLVSFNEAFEAYKCSLGVIDYTSILELACLQSKSIPDFKIVFIDEAQDLSALQWAFAERVMAKAEKIYLAGDDDQAICQSFGAAPEELVTYECAVEIPLEQSYRIPPRVHQFLFSERGIVNRLKELFVRKDKAWLARSVDQDEIAENEGLLAPVHWNELPDLIAAFPNKDWLIMAATHQSIGTISDSLKRLGVPHILSNRVIVPKNSEYLPSVRLATVWGAKGGEAEITVMLTGPFVDTKMLQGDPRLSYVASTRTKNIHLICADNYKSQLEQITSSIEHTRDVSYLKRTQSDELNVILDDHIEAPKEEGGDESIIADLRLINDGKIFTQECLAKAATLEDVIWLQRGPNRGVGLVMSDGTTRAKIYGDLEKTFEVAMRLKGRRIATVPANPARNSITEWFNDIKLCHE